MKKSLIFLHIAIVLAGFTGIFAKLITLNEGLLVWWRMFFSTVLLGILLLLTKRFVSFNRKQLGTLLFAGLYPTMHWLFFYGSIKYSNVSIGVVCFCLTGFFTALLNPVMNRQRLSVTELLLSGLTLAGVLLIFHFDQSFRTGIVLGVISSFFGALYTLNNERLVKKFPTGMINFYQLLGGTVLLGCLLPFYLHVFPVTQLVPSLKDGIYLLILALFCTVGLYLLVAEALKKISAFTVNLSFNLEPVYSILLAMLLFQENKELNISFYVGLALILLSVILQMVRAAMAHRRQEQEVHVII